MTISISNFASVDQSEISPQHVASAVAETRRAVGYTVEELAITTGLANDEIVDIENGANLDQAKLKRIAAALQVPPSTFMVA